MCLSKWRKRHAAAALFDLIEGSIYFIRVAHGGNDNPLAFRICTSFVENDICEGAQEISIGSTCNPEVVSLNVYSVSSNPTDVFQCINPNVPLKDAWYKLTVSTTEDFVIRTTSIDNEYLSSAMELYTSDCGDLQQFACSSNNEPMGNSSIRLDNRQLGETIYIRLANQNNNSAGQFGLCAVLAPSNDFCDNPLTINFWRM